MYPIITLDTVPTEAEQLGSKLKYWFVDEAGNQILFKQGREGTGENWAEKVSCELAQTLNIPHAEYDFAIWGQRRGVVTRSFVPPSGRLVFGNELLARFVRGYAQQRRYRQPYHTVSVVMAVLRAATIAVPHAYASKEIIAASDLFVGYLLFDAWIGNTDRHDENWGLLITPPREIELAPTFDHASSLGRELSDDARSRRLNARDKRRSVEAYSNRARSALFRSSADEKPLTPIGAFLAAAQHRPRAASFWRQQLAAVDWGRVEGVLREVPPSEITRTAADFALQLLSVNRERLLESRN